MAKNSGLTPKELSRATGVSIRAMRLYEEHGLINPARDKNGWRVYESDAISRLNYIITLKQLGLSLAEIRSVLDSGGPDNAAVLRLQEETLETQSRSVASALQLIRTARMRIEQGEALSSELMLDLTRRGTGKTAATWASIFEPLCRKHLTEAQMDLLSRRGAWRDDEAIGRIWGTLIADARELVGGDPSSAAAFAIVRRWRAAQDSYTAGDPSMVKQMAAAWRHATSDPELAIQAPVDAETLDFVSAASLILRAQEAVPDPPRFADDA
jgi:DNA-binding transcriptional MerR regulator